MSGLNERIEKLQEELHRERWVQSPMKNMQHQQQHKNFTEGTPLLDTNRTNLRYSVTADNTRRVPIKSGEQALLTEPSVEMLPNYKEGIQHQRQQSATTLVMRSSPNFF